MNRAAETVCRSILDYGHQREVLERMQTREQLYDYLGYHEYERRLDHLFGTAGAKADNTGEER